VLLHASHHNNQNVARMSIVASAPDQRPHRAKRAASASKA